MASILIFLLFLSPVRSPIIKDKSDFVEINHFYSYNQADKIYKKKFVQVIWWEWRASIYLPKKDILGREVGGLEKSSAFVVKDYRIIWSDTSQPQQVMVITPRRYNNKWICVFYDKDDKVIREVTSGWVRETHTSYDVEMENRIILSVGNRRELSKW